MTPPSTESDLAVLVLQASWALADAAHDLPAGRVSARRREELADTLQALGYVLRVTTPEGERRTDSALCPQEPAPLRVPTPGHTSGAETGAEYQRGWCVASCGCSVEIPPSGAVYVDCPACELPASTRSPADHRLSDPCTPAPGDRPDPAVHHPIPRRGGTSTGEGSDEHEQQTREDTTAARPDPRRSQTRRAGTASSPARQAREEVTDR